MNLATLTPDKTYATMANAQKAVDKVGRDHIDYVIVQQPESGRYFVVFLPTADQLQEAIGIMHNHRFNIYRM